MKPIVTTTVINRPIDEVFDYLTDLDNAPSWSVDLVEVHYDGALREGATGVDVRRLGGKLVEMPWTVTAFARPRTVVLAYTRPLAATATFLLESAEGGTRLTCRTQLAPRGAWRLLAPVIAREARRTDATQFAHVKRILETPDARSDAATA